MTQNPNRSQTLDLIAIFHYVLAAFMYLKGMISLVFIGIGTLGMAGILSDRPHDMHVGMLAIALIFYVGPMLFLCLSWTLATLVLVAGMRINKRRKLGYCQVIAGLECLCVPFGTALGIFTLINLTKSEIKDQFDTQIQ